MKKKLLVFVVTYNAERTIQHVLSRIPAELVQSESHSMEVLIIDDCSQDETFQIGYEYKVEHPRMPITVLKNPSNLGYGGNQKVGYHYALKNGFDYVALLHGDGQYAPEELPKLFQPLLEEKCEAVFGSRMMVRGDALKGGMPLYKYVGNKALTWLQNRIVGTSLSEYHSGYRLYSCKALSAVPYELNSNGFDFDTDIIIQFHDAELRIEEIPTPTFYGDEICYVNGLQYAAKILLACLCYRCQALGLFYQRKYDRDIANTHYTAKFHFLSSHSLGLNAVEPNESLLILGCGGVDLVRPFVEKGCLVTAVDFFISEELRSLCQRCTEGDINSLNLEDIVGEKHYDKVILLDIIEHLNSPEDFLSQLRMELGLRDAVFVITTPNIAFLPVRLMLLLGSFNYGKKGILDKTHTRLFTFRSLRTLLSQHGFEILALKGIPGPYPIAIGNNLPAKLLLSANDMINRLFKGLFSYQIYCEARPLPTLEHLLYLATTSAEQEQEKLSN